jgi:hypothetical protein
MAANPLYPRFKEFVQFYMVQAGASGVSFTDIQAKHPATHETITTAIGRAEEAYRKADPRGVVVNLAEARKAYIKGIKEVQHKGGLT